MKFRKTVNVTAGATTMNCGDERIALYRELAKECERYAAKARRTIVRDHYLYIAQQWHALADQVQNDSQAANAVANSAAAAPAAAIVRQ
jgi:hypothetical protein